MSKKRSVAVAVAGAGAMLGIAAPGWAAGTGNTTNNCYGVYYSTDWDQTCGSGGAGATGYYKSTADCTATQDNQLIVYRLKGSTSTYDGPDCTFEVANVRTVFYT